MNDFLDREEPTAVEPKGCMTCGWSGGVPRPCVCGPGEPTHVAAIALVEYWQKTAADCQAEAKLLRAAVREALDMVFARSFDLARYNALWELAKEPPP